MGYLFPQNSFKEGLARMNQIEVYLRKNLFAKVNRSLKIKKHVKSVYARMAQKKEKNRFGKFIWLTNCSWQVWRKKIGGLHRKLPADWFPRFAYLFLAASLLKNLKTIFKSLFRTLIYFNTAMVSSENNVATNK